MRKNEYPESMSEPPKDSDRLREAQAIVDIARCQIIAEGALNKILGEEIANKTIRSAIAIGNFVFKGLQYASPIPIFNSPVDPEKSR